MIFLNIERAECFSFHQPLATSDACARPCRAWRQGARFLLSINHYHKETSVGHLKDERTNILALRMFLGSIDIQNYHKNGQIAAGQDGRTDILALRVKL